MPLLLTWLAGLLLILIFGSQAVAGVGFLFRPALFAWARPELNQVAQLYKDDRLPIRLGEKVRASEPDHGTASLLNSPPYFPKHAYVQGEKGHRQLTLVVGGYYMTGFYAYIWCEDGKPPTQALRYGIDSSDHVTPRGDGWFEAVVNNGH